MFLRTHSHMPVQPCHHLSDNVLRNSLLYQPKCDRISIQKKLDLSKVMALSIDNTASVGGNEGSLPSCVRGLYEEIDSCLAEKDTVFQYMLKVFQSSLCGGSFVMLLPSCSTNGSFACDCVSSALMKPSAAKMSKHSARHSRMGMCSVNAAAIWRMLECQERLAKRWCVMKDSMYSVVTFVVYARPQHLWHLHVFQTCIVYMHVSFNVVMSSTVCEVLVHVQCVLT